MFKDFYNFFVASTISVFSSCVFGRVAKSEKEVATLLIVSICSINVSQKSFSFSFSSSEF